MALDNEFLMMKKVDKYMEDAPEEIADAYHHGVKAIIPAYAMRIRIYEDQLGITKDVKA